jgi:hypothetical protein
LLVDRLADRWGAGAGPEGRFTVWFELGPSGERGSLERSAA